MAIYFSVLLLPCLLFPTTNLIQFSRTRPLHRTQIVLLGFRYFLTSRNWWYLRSQRVTARMDNSPSRSDLDGTDGLRWDWTRRQSPGRRGSSISCHVLTSDRAGRPAVLMMRHQTDVTRPVLTVMNTCIAHTRFKRWLQIRFDFDSTAIHLRFDCCLTPIQLQFYALRPPFADIRYDCSK